MSMPAPPHSLDRFLTPAHSALWEAVDDFATREIQPRVERMESAQRVDRKIARLLAGRRWFASLPPWSSTEIIVRVIDGTLESGVRVDVMPRSSRPF